LVDNDGIPSPPTARVARAANDIDRGSTLPSSHHQGRFAARAAAPSDAGGGSRSIPVADT
jgi:hypothetical protein